VAALANSAAKTLGAVNFKTALAVLLTFVVCGAGALARSAWSQATEPTADEQTPVVQKSQKSGPPTELSDDALPPGAMIRLGTRRLRHAEGVQCIDFAPDGKTLACGVSGAIMVWDRATGRAIRQIPYDDRLAVLKYSHDCRWLAGAGGKKLTVWETDTGKKIASFDCPAVFEIPNGYSWLTCVPLEFSPDGKRVASVDKDHAILIWNVATGKQAHKLVGHDQEINTLRFSRDGKSLISTSGQRSADGSVRGWDLTTGMSKDPINISSSASQSSHVLAISPDGSTLAVETLQQVREQVGVNTAVYMQHGIRLVEAAGGKERLRLKGNREVIVSALFSPDGAKLFSATRDNQVTVWNVDSGKALHQFQQPPGGSSGGAYALAISADGKTLASSSEGTTVHLWDLATGRELFDLPAHTAAIHVVAFAPDGRTIASAGGDHAIRLWDAHTGKALACLRGHTAGIDALAFSLDSKRLASAAGDESARLWDLNSGREMLKITLENRQLDPHRYVSVRPLTLAFARDDKSLVAGCNDSRFHEWDAATGKEVRSWSWVLSDSAAPTANAEDALFSSPNVRFSPDRKTAAITAGPELHLVDVASGRGYAKLDRKVSQESMAFAEDGRTLVSAGWDKTVKLWEVATGKLIREMAVSEPANAVAFAPNCRYVAVGCGWHNAAIHIFEVATGKEIRVFKGIGAYIGALHFAPDSRTLASGHRDTTAMIWDLSPILAATKPLTLDKAALERLWVDLKSDDAAKAHGALWSFAAAPDSAVGFLKQSVTPVPKVTEARLRQLIADLDADVFDKREAASLELRRIGRDAEQALRAALKETASIEARRRIESVLEDTGRMLPSPEAVGHLRAIQALELIGTEEARALLKKLAEGARAAPETQDASAAITRLAKDLRGKD
jgi:WD40 repeat protein